MINISCLQRIASILTHRRCVNVHQLRPFISKTTNTTRFLPKYIKGSIPASCDMVYTSSLSHYIYWGKISVMSVCGPTIAVSLYGLMTSPASPEIANNLTLGNYFPIFTAALIWSVIQVFVVHFLSHHMLYLIYQDRQTKLYTAVSPDNFLSTTTIDFTEDDCVRRDLEGRFSYSLSLGNLYIKDRCFTVNWKDFAHQIYFNRLMHYDETTVHADEMDEH